MSRKPLERVRLILSRLFAFCLVAVMLSSVSAWESSLVSAGLFAAGCLLIGVAVVGRMWCALYIAGYKTHTLVTLGPYSVSRNPLYFFNLLGGLGVALCTETLTMPLVVGIAFALYYPLIIANEASRLRAAHGEAYDAYCRRTPAFWPRWRNLREADTYMVNAMVVRKNALEAVWFMAGIALLEILEQLHELGHVPVGLRLY